MKRLLTVFLALVMMLGVTGVTVFAEEDMAVVSVQSKDIPDDPFSGEAERFEGGDGSVTYVYENGSMKTEYADGTKQGIDYEGNLYKEEKDGTQTLTKMDGSRETIRPDGTSESKDITGLVTVTNADGDVVSMGYENGEKIKFTDGLPPEGESTIAGPNGESLTIKNVSNEDGGNAEFSITAEGNGKSYGVSMGGDEENSEVHIKWPDGTEGSMNENEDGTGAISLKLNDGTGMSADITADGVNMRINTDGLNMDVTIDGNGGSCYTFENTKTGDSSSYGSDGSMNIRNADGTGIQIDGSGQCVWANIKDENGIQLLKVDGDKYEYADPDDPSRKLVIEMDEDGNVKSVETPEGDIVEFLEDGSILKNGEVLRDLINAEEPEDTEDTSAQKETGDTQEPTDDSSSEDEAQELIDADGESGLSASRVAGTYYLTGTYTWVSDSESGTETDDLTMTVSATGDTRLEFIDEGESLSADYDPETGKAVIYSDGIPFYCTFSESDGTIQFTMTYNYTYENVQISGSRSGYKQ